MGKPETRVLIFILMAAAVVSLGAATSDRALAQSGCVRSGETTVPSADSSCPSRQRYKVYERLICDGSRQRRGAFVRNGVCVPQKANQRRLSGGKK